MPPICWCRAGERWSSRAVYSQHLQSTDPAASSDCHDRRCSSLSCLYFSHHL